MVVVNVTQIKQPTMLSLLPLFRHSQQSVLLLLIILLLVIVNANGSIIDQNGMLIFIFLIE